MTRKKRKDALLLPDPELIDVLELMAHGKTAKAIGRELRLTFEGVKTRQKRIYEQLHARNAAHAITLGYRRGLLKLADAYDPMAQCAWHTLQIHDRPDSFTGERTEVTCPDECRQLPPGAVCWYIYEPWRAEWPTEPGMYRIRPYHHTVQRGEDGDVEVEFQVQKWGGAVPSWFDDRGQVVPEQDGAPF